MWVSNRKLIEIIDYDESHDYAASCVYGKAFNSITLNLSVKFKIIFATVAYSLRANNTNIYNNKSLPFSTNRAGETPTRPKVT